MMKDFIVWLSHTSYLGWATIFVDLLKGLAWPAVASFAVWTFRLELSALAGKVASFEGLGMKIDFKREVKNLAEDVERVVGSDAVPDRDQHAKLLPAEENDAPEDKPADDTSRDAFLAEFDDEALARSVITSAWLQIEKALQASAERYGLSTVSRAPMRHSDLVPLLVRTGAMSAEIASLVQRARHIRNAAAHPSESKFDLRSAREYADLAQQIVEAMA